MNRPSYNDIFVLLSQYCEATLPFFADGWERFPVGTAAQRVVEDLRAAADWYETRKPELAQQMRSAIAEIERRAAE